MPDAYIYHFIYTRTRVSIDKMSIESSEMLTNNQISYNELDLGAFEEFLTTAELTKKAILDCKKYIDTYGALTIEILFNAGRLNYDTVHLFDQFEDKSVLALGYKKLLQNKQLPDDFIEVILRYPSLVQGDLYAQFKDLYLLYIEKANKAVEELGRINAKLKELNISFVE